MKVTLLSQWLLHITGILRQYYGFVFDYLNQILQLGFSLSESDYSCQIGVGSRVMVNHVLILVYRVLMNVVMHIHTLAWIV